MKYIIIGNGTAGIGAVEAIRQQDEQGEITIISNERHHTYSRPLISYLLQGKTTEEKMKYRGDGFYQDNGVELLLSKTVSRIDSLAKNVILDDGRKLKYDKLLVATGSSPFVPPINGLDTVKDKFTFSSLDDAKALEGCLKKDAMVLILGAGLIGLKCAEGIHKKAKCTCVDLSTKVLSSILDDEASAIVKKHLENNGVTCYLGVQVKEFKENKAILSDGNVINFDVLVLAVGVRPNAALVQDIGGKVGRGITVNERGETSVPDIYAAGDCTESVDVSTGETKVMALLPNAYMQGECAGHNMAGVRSRFEQAIPMNAIRFFGLSILTAGNYEGEVYREDDGLPYKGLYYKGNRLSGYIMIGNIAKAGIYTNLIRERTPLDSLDFDLICKNPGLMAFSKDVRREKLAMGGVRDENRCNEAGL